MCRNLIVLVSLMRVALLLLCGLFLVSCAQQSEKGLGLELLEHAAWPVLVDEYGAESLLSAIKRQLLWFESQQSYEWKVGKFHFDGPRIKATLTRFRDLYSELGENRSALRSALQREFQMYRFKFDGRSDVLITGYYAPILKGTIHREGTYQYPLYGTPDDMVFVDSSTFNPKMLSKGPQSRSARIPARVSNGEVVAYFSRKEIDGQNALAGRGLELVYLNDYFDAFTFHIQGGGFVKLQSGELMKLNFSAQNGLPYQSIGRMLVDNGSIPQNKISMQALAAWFKAHPQDLYEICYQNPSYVFYETDGKRYAQIAPELFPKGALGFPVTTRRSIATDKRYFPGGALAFIRGHQQSGEQDGGSNSARPFSAFVIDQDTGGAIRKNHIDWFTGTGEVAQFDAGSLRDDTGEVFFLILNQQMEY